MRFRIRIFASFALAFAAGIFAQAPAPGGQRAATTGQRTATGADQAARNHILQLRVRLSQHRKNGHWLRSEADQAGAV